MDHFKNTLGDFFRGFGSVFLNKKCTLRVKIVLCMINEKKSTSFVNSRFGVKGIKGLSKSTEKVFNSAVMKKLTI